MRPSVPPPPSLCAQGPCAHYHKFTTQLDAEGARAAGVVPGGSQHGRLIGAGSEVFHTESHHYCYPSPGVSNTLGALPVMDCSLWSPIDGATDAAIHERRRMFLVSGDGSLYRATLARWHHDRKVDDAAQAAAEAAAARVIADMDAAAPRDAGNGGQP